MRARLVLLAVVGTLAAGPPAAAGERVFHSLTLGYSTRSGMFYGLARSDSLSWAELRTGIVYGGGDRAAVQVGLRRELFPDVTAMVAVSEPLPAASPRALRDDNRQVHGDIFWKDFLGLSLDGKGEQRQLTLNVWQLEIPIAGHVDGVPWVLR